MIESIITAVVAIGGIGLVLGLILSISAKIFAVKVNKKVEQVLHALPGINCGACGFPNCEALAESMVAGESEYDSCIVGGPETTQAVAKVFGVEATQQVKRVARVMCSGTKRHAIQNYDYMGIETCQAATTLFGGELQCKYGCLGLGDCLRACPFGAIGIIEGIAIINNEKCKSCEKCVAACPKNIIRMLPITSEVTVLCSNEYKPKQAVLSCKRGCIGCRKCAISCPENAITVENFLAIIDHEKCTNCGKCITVCPVSVIFRYEG